MDHPVYQYHGTRHPGELGEAEVVAYLTYLASERRVSRSTQMQALSALMLRLKDLDFARREICVRRGKGGKDRVTMLPEIARAGLEAHLERVRTLHARDLRDGAGSVELPTALVRKAPA